VLEQTRQFGDPRMTCWTHVWLHVVILVQVFKILHIQHVVAVLSVDEVVTFVACGGERVQRDLGGVVPGAVFQVNDLHIVLA
jgi:hypothetical protein